MSRFVIRRLVLGEFVTAIVWAAYIFTMTQSISRGDIRKHTMVVAKDDTFFFNQQAGFESAIMNNKRQVQHFPQHY